MAVSYHKNPSVVCAELEDSAILLDLDTKYYYNLNETGLRIWQLLDGARDAAEIAQELSNEFDVNVVKALASAERLIAELSNAGLVVLA